MKEHQILGLEKKPCLKKFSKENSFKSSKFFSQIPVKFKIKADFVFCYKTFTYNERSGTKIVLNKFLLVSV